MSSLSSLSLSSLVLCIGLSAACSRDAKTNALPTADTAARTEPGGSGGSEASSTAPTAMGMGGASSGGPIRIESAGGGTGAVGLGLTPNADSMLGGGGMDGGVVDRAGTPPGMQGAGAARSSFNPRSDPTTPVAGVTTTTPVAGVAGVTAGPAAAGGGNAGGAGSSVPGRNGALNQGGSAPGTIGNTPGNRPGMDPNNPASPVAPPAGVVPMR